MENIYVAYFSVYAISAFKFIGGIFLGLTEGLSVFETAVFTFLGSISSISVVSLAGDKFRTHITRFMAFVKKKVYALLFIIFQRLMPEKLFKKFQERVNYRLQPKRFTKLTRLSVKAWNRSGIKGIAFLTPVLLSPILGTIVAVSFRVPSRKLIPYMAVSCLVFSFAFSFVFKEFSDLIEEVLGIRVHMHR